MIDIVIVNWNAGRLIRDCVDSLLTEGNEKWINKIFIIDNASTDKSADLQEIHEKIFIIKNRKNEGFSKAANQGFRLCSSKYVLLLNPDTRLFPDTLSLCIQLMEDRSDIDILGCRFLRNDGSTAPGCSRFPRPCRYLTDALGLPKLFPEWFRPAVIMEDWDHQTSRFVDQVMGAFMFMKTEVMNKIGYFDEQFFVYYEDVDFSKRLSEAGGLSWFDADIRVHHIGKGTTASDTAYRLYLNLSSRMKYGKKHFSVSGYLFLFFVTFCIEPFSRTIFHLATGNLKETANTWKAYWRLVTKK